MNVEIIVSVLSALASVVVIAAYYSGKLADAEKMGALKQRVEQLEKDNCKSESTKDKLDALILAVGTLTAKVEGLEKRFDDREKRDDERR